jgi:hypothetical protein
MTHLEDLWVLYFISWKEGKKIIRATMTVSDAIIAS